MDDVASVGQEALCLRPDCGGLQDTPLPELAAIVDRATKPGKAVNNPKEQRRTAELPIARSGRWAAIQRRMLSHGYCSHHVNYLTQRFDYPTCRKLASLDKNIHRKANHSPCADTDQCIAFNIDERNYEQKHTPQCAQSACSQVFVPYNDLVRIIQTGGVPLVSIKESTEGHLSIRVHRRHPYDTYVVISHVWADGLGNSHANSLLSCQLRQLRTIFAYKGSTDFQDGWLGFVGAVDNVNGLKNVWKWGSHEVLWMDTLCIPVKEEHQHLRTKCINDMASIYAGARRVFVLDKELMATTFSEAYNLYHIASSVWMCRSWTLQEATLPEQCVIQFADCIIDPLRRSWFGEGGVRATFCQIQISLMIDAAEPLEASEDSDSHSTASENAVLRQGETSSHQFDQDLVQAAGQQEVSLAEDADINIRNYIEKFMTICHTNYPIGTFSEDLRTLELISAWNELAGRSTTKPEDQYVVLASCLGFKLKQFQNLDSAEERMHRMLLNFERLPIGLLFNSGTKSKGKNRWLPTRVGRDLLHMGSYMLLPNQRVSKYSAQSRRIKLELRDELQPYLLDGAIPFTDDFIFCTEDGETYRGYSLNPPGLQLPLLQYLASCVVFQTCPSNVMPEKAILRGALFYIK